MNYSEAKLKARRHIPVTQVVNRPLKRVSVKSEQDSVASVKAINLFISPRADEFKKTIDDIRNVLDTYRKLHVSLRDMVEDAYDKSIQDINALKAEIELRRSQNKPLISLGKQLNRAIAHSAALYTALAPVYQAEAIANVTKPNEYLTEIVSKINSV